MSPAAPAAPVWPRSAPDASPSRVALSQPSAGLGPPTFGGPRTPGAVASDLAAVHQPVAVAVADLHGCLLFESHLGRRGRRRGGAQPAAGGDRGAVCVDRSGRGERGGSLARCAPA